MLDLTDRRRDPCCDARSARASRDRVERMLFARRDAGDPAARDQLIERFLPLARAVARRYECPGEPLDDLVQVAAIGLVKAIDRFETSRGHAFTSYAVPTIAGELKRYFRDRTWAVRPPRALLELTLRVDAAAVRLAHQLDRAPTVRELAQAVGADDEQVLEARQARRARYWSSLQAPASAGAAGTCPPLQDSLAHEEDGYERAENRMLLGELVDYLSPREREVVRLRFEHDLIQSEIGARLGISQMHVSRILRQAITRLRHVADRQEELAATRAARSADDAGARV